MDTSTLPTLDNLLEYSAATPAFRQAAHTFQSTHHSSAVIAFNPGAPPAKVLRVLCQLFHARPQLHVDGVKIDGVAGCNDFRGTLAVRLADGSTKRFRFVWDCAWKARELGWKTFFGDDDQQRAAREMGYQCFEVFEEI